MSAEEKVDVLKELLDCAVERVKREEIDLRKYSISHRRTYGGKLTLYLIGEDHCYLFFFNPLSKRAESFFIQGKHGGELSERLRGSIKLFYEPQCPVSREDFVNEPSDVTNDPQGPLFKEDYRKEH